MDRDRERGREVGGGEDNKENASEEEETEGGKEGKYRGRRG